MTRHEAQGTASHGTGDINLASACMAIGIPLVEHPHGDSCKLILRGGSNYARFFLTPISTCGKFATMQVMAYWSDPSDIPSDQHPFGWILEFIRARPDGCRTSGDWLDFAHDFLAARGDLPRGFPRSIDDIGDICKTAPEARASYILAFVHCRRLCLMLVDQARRAVMQSKGGSHTLIDTTLPRQTRNNLIARLDG